MQLFYKIGILKNFSKFARKHLCWSLVFNKFAGLQPATLFYKSLQRRCFPINFDKLILTYATHALFCCCCCCCCFFDFRQYFMNPRQPSHFFLPREKFFGNTHATHPTHAKILTYAIHELTPSTLTTPPMLFSRLRREDFKLSQ